MKMCIFGTFRHCFSRMVKRVIFFVVSHDGHTTIKHFGRLNNSASVTFTLQVTRWRRQFAFS